MSLDNNYAFSFGPNPLSLFPHENSLCFKIKDDYLSLPIYFQSWALPCLLNKFGRVSHSPVRPLALNGVFHTLGPNSETHIRLSFACINKTLFLFQDLSLAWWFVQISFCLRTWKLSGMGSVFFKEKGPKGSTTRSPVGKKRGVYLLHSPVMALANGFDAWSPWKNKAKMFL